MNKLFVFIKKINLHILVPVLIILAIGGSAFFILKWAKGVDSDYDRDSVEDGYDVEVLDRMYYIYPDTFENHTPNETKKILCFGNAPFADDRDSKDNLCNLIAEGTGAEVVNLSIPDSVLAMQSPKGNIVEPFDYHTFYYLSYFATIKDETLYDAYNQLSRGKSEIGDEVVDYLWKLDMNTIDTVVLMYDGTDYLKGHIKETPENVSNPYTFCGNMYAGINLIQDLYPHVQIIVMSPTYAYALDEDGNYISSDIVKVEGDSLSRYAITQLNLCLVAEVSFIDNIFGTVNADNADEYLEDNLHLNVEGRKAVAKRFNENYLNSWSRYK